MTELNTFLKNEVWVRTFYGVHEVSNFGHVRNFKTKRMLMPVKKPNGYLQISAMVNGKVKSLRLHRIIASSFLTNSNGLPQVNHINGIRSDNRVVNLEWCSGRKNVQHSYDRLGANHGRVRPVLAIDKNGFTEFFVSARDAHRKTGVAHQLIYKCCNNKIGKAGGYSWEYLEESTVRDEVYEHKEK